MQRRIRNQRRQRVSPIAAIAAMPLVLASCVLAPPAARHAPPSAIPAPAVAGTMPAAIAPRPAAAALPRPVAFASQADRIRATVCLASAVYYEAAHEPEDGQRAVAQVVLNRMRHSAWPKTVCGVVYEGSGAPGCQFSFACDGAEARRFDAALWARARRVADAALAGYVHAPVGDATFYHTHAVRPAWRLRMETVAVIGAHIFYRLPEGSPHGRVIPGLAYRGGEALPARQNVSATLPAAIRIPATRIAEDRTVATDARPTPDASEEAGSVKAEWQASGTWIAQP